MTLLKLSLLEPPIRFNDPCFFSEHETSTVWGCGCARFVGEQFNAASGEMAQGSGA